MKLQAVTICINYADFLECVVANRRHFDRWVVVTCAEDARTRELCARHGMECIVSTLLQADGKDFHAVDAKWHVLNEGLSVLAGKDEPRLYETAPGRRRAAQRGRMKDESSEAASPRAHDPSAEGPSSSSFRLQPSSFNSWVVVLDADVLLPRHFRERLEALPLERGHLYGVAGRKVIEDREAFEQARACEPWTTLVGRNSQADRAVLRRLLAEEVKSIGTQASSLLPADEGAGMMLGAHSAGNVARIPDGSLDLLYLAGEVTPDWLATALRHWMPKLRDGGVVCGDFFGLPHWREGSIAATRAAKKLGGQPLSLLMRVAIEELQTTAAWSDARRKGWKFPPMHHYWRRSRKPAVHSPVITSAVFSGTHLKHLAEDVVAISLPERTDRRERVEAMMEREGVAFRFVDGVRVLAEEIEPHEIAEVGHAEFKTRINWGKYLRGMVGCRRAHIRCLRDAFDAGLRSLLIMEDDVRLEDGWHERFAAAHAELPPGWLQLCLSASEYRPAEPFSRHLRRVAGTHQTTAILYSEAGIEAALECLSRARNEIDCWLGDHLQPFGCSYVIHPRIASQDGGVSDIMGLDRGVTP